MISSSFPAIRAQNPLKLIFKAQIRRYRALAIESSCDDTCVALLERSSPTSQVTVIGELKETLRSEQAGGVVPLDALHFHQQTVARLVRQLGETAGFGPTDPPDLICVTRGPGMMGSLSATLQFAKGLAYAWNRPLVGAHHMLGHLLTPKLPQKIVEHSEGPQYPFLSLLCSGGHTMLVLLSSIDKHEVIIDTIDIAAGDALDKAARELKMLGTMIGPVLERFVLEIDPITKESYNNVRTDGQNPEFPLIMSMPMTSSKHQRIPKDIRFSFASFPSAIQHFCKTNEIGKLQRQFAAHKLQELVFGHIVDRINVAFTKSKMATEAKEKKATEHFWDLSGVKDFVCSGGVGANSTLREKLRNNLEGLQPLRFHFPDPALCTDNAAMIGNVGMEIFETLRLKSDLDVLAIRKWPMDKLLDVDGWQKVSDEEYRKVTGFLN